MHKTISITNDTYQNLNAIATRLEKPKSQVVDELVKGYIAGMEEQETKELQAYNKFVDNLAEQVKLPQVTIIKSEDLDKDLAVLKDQTL